MENLFSIGLPLALAIIMLSLGIGLEVRDFKRVLARKKAFVLGLISQILLLPAVTLAVLAVFATDRTFAMGVLFLVVCPSGITSSLLAKYARGDVALSLSLTASTSLIGLATLPTFTAWANPELLKHTDGLSISALTISMFLIITLPVAVGVTIRQYFRHAAIALEPALSVFALVLLVLIVFWALILDGALLVDHAISYGGPLLGLSLLTFAIGLALARIGQLNWAETKTVAIETGIQNTALSVTLVGLFTGVTQGFASLSLPSVIYSLTMYLVVVPFVLWARNHR